jgi:putative polyhydroxyalkanoate system protein
MATVDIRRAHDLGKDGARKAVERMTREARDMVGIEYEWEGDVVKFSRPGASGSIRADAREVCVSVSLGWGLGLLKGRIENEIKAYLDRNF